MKTPNLKHTNSYFDGLLHQLFPAYLTCPDQQFRRYIESKQDAFDEGSDLTADELMQCALYKYKTLLDKGTWQAPDCQQEQILALETQIKQLKNSAGGNKSTKKTPHSKSKGHKKAPRPRADIQWMFDPPPEIGPFKKLVGGKEYEWCSLISGAPPGKGCDKWVRHPPNECNGTRKRFLNARAKGSKPQGSSAATSTKNTRRVLQVKSATISAMECSDSSSDDSGDEYPEWLAKSDRSPAIKSMEGPNPPAEK